MTDLRDLNGEIEIRRTVGGDKWTVRYSPASDMLFIGGGHGDSEHTPLEIDPKNFAQLQADVDFVREDR